MANFIFDRERREEAARIKELRGLLGQVEQPDFWGRMSKARGSRAGESDSFQQAIERRAKILGVTPQMLLGNYMQQLQQSTYPTPDCLEAEEVQTIVASQSKPEPEQASHLQSCIGCQQLLAACQQSPRETEKLMAKIRAAAAKAAQPRRAAGTTAANMFTGATNA